MLRQVNIMYIFSRNFFQFLYCAKLCSTVFSAVSGEHFKLFSYMGTFLLHVLAIFLNFTKITSIWLNKGHESYTSSYQAIQIS